MATILIGGPNTSNGIVDPVHDELINKLAGGGDTVVYHCQVLSMVLDLLAGTKIKLIRRDSTGAMRQIAGILDLPADIVLYDTRLFFSEYPLDKRAREFSSVAAVLNKSHAPIVVLVEEGASEIYRSHVRKAGFIQVDQPYNLDGLVKLVKQTYRLNIN